MAKATENIRPKGVPILLDRERRLRFTFAGLEYLTEKYGDLTTAFNSMTDPQAGLNAKTLTAMVDFAYAGLMHEDKDLTREHVAEIIDLENINDLAQAIVMSVNAALPAQKGGTGTPR